MTMKERAQEFRRRFSQLMLEMNIGHASISIGMETGEPGHYARATMLVHNGLLVSVGELLPRHGDSVVSLVEAIKSLEHNVHDCPSCEDLTRGVNHPPAQA